MITKSVCGGFLLFIFFAFFAAVTRCLLLFILAFRSYSINKTELFENQVKTKNCSHLSSYVYALAWNIYFKPCTGENIEGNCC